MKLVPKITDSHVTTIFANKAKTFSNLFLFFFCCSLSPFLLTLNKIRENMNDDFGSE